MSELRFGFCDHDEEYVPGKPKRLQGKNLREQSLYVAMFALGDQVQKAARCAVKLTRLQLLKNGAMCEAGLTILNPSGSPDIDQTAVYEDGYWIYEGSDKIEVGGIRVVTGYLRNYEVGDEMDQGLQSIIAASCLPTAS